MATLKPFQSIQEEESVFAIHEDAISEIRMEAIKMLMAHNLHQINSPYTLIDNVEGMKPKSP
jgi:hypothetical protein